MSKHEKMEIIRQVESSKLSISSALKKFDMPRSTYTSHCKSARGRLTAVYLPAHKTHTHRTLHLKAPDPKSLLTYTSHCKVSPIFEFCTMVFHFSL